MEGVMVGLFYVFVAAILHPSGQAQCVPACTSVGSTCIAGRGSFTCECNAGYTGDGTTCDDVDECTQDPNVCHVNAICTNTGGSYTCTCETGYTGDGTMCADVDECTQDPNVCHVNAMCADTEGSYTCTCKTGYTGDGTMCADTEPPQFQDGTCPSDIDEVAEVGESVKMVTWTDPTASDTTGDEPTVVCTPQSDSDFMIGDHDVTCTATDAAGNQATTNCTFTVTVTDYNECNDNPSVCDTNADCTNTPGSHVCSCRAGYTGDGTTCTECDDGKYGLDCASDCSCVSRGTCNKVTGECTCDPILGFTNAVCNVDAIQVSMMRADGQSGSVPDTEANDNVALMCTVNVPNNDIDGSVKLQYPDGPQTTMSRDTNQHGVYRAEVTDVHPRNSGDYTCIVSIKLESSNSIIDKTSIYNLVVTDVDECATTMYQCDVNAHCVNENMEGGYNCECNSGYRFADDGVTCEDIDECTDPEVTDTCVLNANCINTIGSFSCECEPGYSGDGYDLCQECIQGEYGLGCNEDCTCVAPVPGGNDVLCNNVDGTCSCNPEFTDKACDKRDLSVMLTSDPSQVLDTKKVDNVTLVCAVNLHSRDLQSVDITFENGTMIKDTTLTNPTEGIYERTLYDISLSDSAVYRCTATTMINGSPSTKYGDVTLDVLEPGRIIEVTEKVEGELGETVVVDCIVYADPAPTITWYDPNSMVITSDGVKYTVSSTTDEQRERLTSSLTVKNLIRNDNGSYKCETQNGLTDEVDQKFAEVVVIEVPEVGPVVAIAVSSESIDVTWTVTYDGNLPFTCRIEYREVITSTWKPSTPNPPQQSLSHHVTGLEAFTSYSIQVTCNNRVGDGIPSILVIPVKTKQAAPSAPRNPRVTAVTSESLTVEWDEPEMKRGTISFYRVSVEGVAQTHQTPRPVNPAPLSLLVSGLNPFTDYNLFVTAFNEEDGVELMGENSDSIPHTTAESIPTSPVNVVLNNTGKTCVVTWDQPNNENGTIVIYTISRLAHFYPTTGTQNGANLIPDVDKTDEVEVRGDQRSYSVYKSDLQPYARYRFAITASTTIGKGVPSRMTVATCDTPVAAPLASARPVLSDKLDSVTASSFKIVIEPASQRTGPISCLELTLVQLNRNEGIDGKDPDIWYHPDLLGTYQQAQESMSTSYVAMVFTGNEITNSMEVEIGVGGKTSCGGNASSRKRRQSKREHVGNNGALRPNTRYTAFLRAYSVLEDGMEVYSTSPLMQSIQTGEEPSNNVAIIAVVVILSTLLIVAVAVIILVLRSKKNRDSRHTQDTRRNMRDTRFVGATVEMNPSDYEQTTDTKEQAEAVVYEDVGLPFWAVRWQILWSNLDVDDKILGRGNFGEVRSGTVNQGGQRTKCAIKILKGQASPTDKQDFLEEFRTMTTIGYHPNVVSLIGACQHEEVMYVALEYLPHGDLRNHLRSSRPDSDSEPSLTSEQLIKFALGVAMGMEHLATSAVIHRDLAARNILLGRGLVAKVSDFGLSRGEDIYVQTSMRRVPTRWLSIESILHKTYTTKSDVWSFGILLWEIATLGGTPYPSFRTKDLASQLTDGYRMSKPPNCDEKIYTLMIRCWGEKPSKRPSFSDLVTVLSEMNESQINQTYMAFKRPHYENFSIIRPELDDN